MTKEFERFIHNLQRELTGPLPGREAQYRMAPRPRSGGEMSDGPGPDVRRGGVLVLFYPHQDRVHLPLILRPTYQGVHSGQVAFPGGGYEENDGDLETTSLREANEEIGIPLQDVTVLGQLSSLYIYASNYLVQPTVAWIPMRPTFRTDPHEVEKLLEIPLAALQNEQNRRCEPWNLRGRKVMVPFFAIQNQTIWGATAMMLSELLSLKLNG